MNAHSTRGLGGLALLCGALGAQPRLNEYALILQDPPVARQLSSGNGLRTRADFPAQVGDALAFLAARDPLGYIEAIEAVLESFETREEYLEDLPVADTVLVLQALAGRRDMTAELSSSLLPG